MSQDLETFKPCPFCGHTPSFRTGNEHSFIGGYLTTLHLECGNCYAEMSLSFGKEGSTETTEQDAKKELLDCWNNRL